MILAAIILTATGMAFGAFQRLVAFAVTLAVILVGTAVIGIAAERPLSHTLAYLGLEYISLQVGYALSVVVASVRAARATRTRSVDEAAPPTATTGVGFPNPERFPEQTLKRT